MESLAAFSAVCRNCGLYWRVQEMLKPAAKVAAPLPEQRRIACFDCGAEFDVPAGAQSTMCKKCSSYIDLHDYSITQAVSKNFKTKGSFVIQPAGYVFNSEAIVANAVIKGRFIGKLIVEHSLTLHSGADIKGSMTAARLIIPASQQFRWTGEIHVGAAEIAGELNAMLIVKHQLCIRSSGRFVGKLHAGSVLAEPGAQVAVEARIGAGDPNQQL